ncbi:MAG: hypothetical protein LBO66_00875 [Deltaproteobacteria bacterium]|nr:hypothetical protein [Deltaproteobacteria bacterium]
MSSQIHENLIALDELKKSLTQTMAKLDAIKSQSVKASASLQEEIGRKIKEYADFLDSADRDYEALLATSRSAEYDASVQAYFFREYVGKLKASLDNVADALKEFQILQKRTSKKTSLLLSVLSNKYEEYNELMSKGFISLDKFVCLLNLSNARLTEEGGGSSGSSALSLPQGAPVTGGSEVITAMTLSEIKNWIKDINPLFSSPYFPAFSVNPGSRAFAVWARLSGAAPSAEANPDSFLCDKSMETVTGKKPVYMSKGEIESVLRERGAGAHLIIGINRENGPDGKTRPGHWFNAYYDGQEARIIDGQSGEILHWSHDYGHVKNYCALT